MQPIINDAVAVILVSLLIAGAATALILFRPWKRRHRHRKRHSHRPRIDLFKAERSETAAKTDA
jgi:hypothetical protein